MAIRISLAIHPHDPSASRQLALVLAILLGWGTTLLGYLAALPTEALPAAPVAADDEPEDRGMRGVLAVRGNQVLLEEGAEQLFVPASVQKLVVAAAGLHSLGPDYRVRTGIFGSLEPNAGKVDDLVVLGAGDPTWNDLHFEKNPRAPLEQLAESLHQAGVRRITGDLVVDASRFPGRSRPINWPWSDTALGFGAAPSALAIDLNTARIRVAPGQRVGDRAKVSGDREIVWTNFATTVSADRHGRGTIDFQMIWGTPEVIVRGEFPLSEAPFAIEVAAPDPLRRAGAALAQALLDRGIELAGGVRVEHRPSTRGLDELAAYTSAPLSSWLEHILSDSNNWYAEMLLRVLALEVAGEGRLDLGLDVLSRFLIEDVGAAKGSFELDDGSGLSPSNLLSPKATVALLSFSLEQKWRDVFLASLATPEQGTLSRSWRSPPPLAAKTGTLRHTQTLAGVLDPTSERPTVFAVFLNHRTEGRRELKAEILQQLWRLHRSP